MAAQIIDLTRSPEPVTITIDSDVETPARSVATHSQRSRRPRRAQTASAHRSPQGSTAHSREKAPPADPREQENGHLAEGFRNSKELGSTLPTTSPSQRHHYRLSSPKHDSDLFFIDVTCSEIVTVEKDHEASSLLLPPHVYVGDGDEDDNVQLEEPRITPDPQADDYIEYLDFDDHRAAGTTRYFDADQEENKQKRTVCKNCGDNHLTYQCTVRICLTCGARDEHSTRGCPISKTCFRCGMKGHISSNCPNYYPQTDSYNACDRCGSDIHKSNECPTLWRMYEYVAQDERDFILKTRRSKSMLAIGAGGEGYIAEDLWCYNCGECGHWGDDCREERVADQPLGTSAFGSYNVMSGPFYDPAERAASPPVPSRPPRDWERSENGIPTNVGMQGRKKAREKLQRQAELLEDEEDDWFEKPRYPRRARTPTGPALQRPGNSRFDDRPLRHHIPPPRRQQQNHSRPALLDRIEFRDIPQAHPDHAGSHASSSHRYRGSGHSHSRRDQDSSRRHDSRARPSRRDEDGYVHSRRADPGPRYTGGYTKDYSY